MEFVRTFPVILVSYSDAVSQRMFSRVPLVTAEISSAVSWTVCVCVGVCMVFSLLSGCDSGMTFYYTLACLYTFAVIFIPICIRLCYLGRLSDCTLTTGLASSCSSPSVLRGELRTRLRSSELKSVPLTYDVIVATRLCLLGCCGGRDWALAGRAVVWPSSVVSSSPHHRGKHDS